MRPLPVVLIGGVLLGAGVFFYSRRAAASVDMGRDSPAVGGVLQDVLVAVSGIGSRGIRNNNPGNIRESELDKTLWQGERATDDDAAFEEFDTPEAGIRAMVVILKNYRRRGIVTVEQIIPTWAPAADHNDVAAYIQSVSNFMSFPINQVILDSDFPALVAAIIKHENGIQPYDMATIERGVNAA